MLQAAEDREPGYSKRTTEVRPANTGGLMALVRKTDGAGSERAVDERVAEEDGSSNQKNEKHTESAGVR